MFLKNSKSIACVRGLDTLIKGYRSFDTHSKSLSRSPQCLETLIHCDKALKQRSKANGNATLKVCKHMSLEGANRGQFEQTTSH